MNRAIVTGAAGFVGYHLMLELINCDYEVLAVVRSKEESDKISALKKENIEISVCEIPNFENLYNIASGVYDVFFHFAWAGVSGESSKNFAVQMNNVQNAIKAVQVAKRLHCKRFLGAGSLQEIECIMEMEQSKQVVNLGNYYKIAKLAAHYFCKLEALQQDIDFLWPRLTNTYGAGEVSSRLINSTIRKLLKGESPAFTEATQLYNFIYITDAARAYRLIGEIGISNSSYILGSEDVRPLREYLLKIQSIVNPSIEMRFGEYDFQGISLPKNHLHDDRFFSDTGFSTTISFDEGIELTRKFILGA